MDQKTIRYSIIIPVFNSKATLSRCLESVLAQHREDLEALLIDDGSTDGSREMCRRYAAEHGCFRFFPRAHGGVSAARNYGLSQAQGRYVLFLDSDDFLAGDCLSVLDGVLQTADWDLIQFSTNLLVGEMVIRRVFPAFSCAAPAELIDQYARLLCRRKVNAPWGKVYRLDLIREHEIAFPQGLSLGEDKVFNLRYIMRCRRFAILSETLYWTCLDNMNSLSRRLRPDVERQMREEAALSRRAVLDAALPAAQQDALLRALAFDRLRNVYTLGKYYHRSAMPVRARYRELSRLCSEIRSEKLSYPATAFCRLCALPVRWSLLPVIDAMAWKMAFHGLANLNDKKKSSNLPRRNGGDCFFAFRYGCKSITAISGRLKMRGTRSCPESPEVMIMRMPSLS